MFVRACRSALRPDLRAWLPVLGLIMALGGVSLPVSADAPDRAASGQEDGAQAQRTGSSAGAAPASAPAGDTQIYLPLISKPVVPSQACAPIPGTSYDTISVNPPSTDRPARAHADLNLSLRGYKPVQAHRGLVDYGGGTDSAAPQFPGLFADGRTATFSTVYRVYDWNWGCNCRGPLLTKPEVSLAGLATAPDEILHVPNSGYSIGSLGNGYEVLVLYATTDRITLKYTREDNVIRGYTLQVEGVCVEPYLLALYEASNSAGRGRLPALRAGQPFGRAKGQQIGVAIRDNGAFMDPRSRKDWWQGR